VFSRFSSICNYACPSQKTMSSVFESSSNYLVSCVEFINSFARSEVFRTMKIQIAVSWVVIPCNCAGYQRFEGLWRREQYDAPNHWYLTSLRGVTIQKTATWIFLPTPLLSRGSSVSIVSRLRGRGGGRFLAGAGILSPDRLWGSPSLLSSGYRGFVPSGWSTRDVKLTTHPYLVLRLRMRGAIPPLHQHVFVVWCLIKQWVHLHDVVII